LMCPLRYQIINYLRVLAKFGYYFFHISPLHHVLSWLRTGSRKVRHDL
jgi:hypothetical protein